MAAPDSDASATAAAADMAPDSKGAAAAAGDSGGEASGAVSSAFKCSQRQAA